MVKRTLAGEYACLPPRLPAPNRLFSGESHAPQEPCRFLKSRNLCGRGSRHLSHFSGAPRGRVLPRTSAATGTFYFHGSGSGAAQARALARKLTMVALCGAPPTFRVARNAAMSGSAFRFRGPAPRCSGIFLSWRARVTPPAGLLFRFRIARQSFKDGCRH